MNSGMNENMNREQLFNKIQALAFAKNEAELYLDVYPECREALEYYKGVVSKLAAFTEKYENLYGPITASGVRGDRWSWIEGAWPWQINEREEER